jgi:transcription antitermination factor NusG
MTWFVLRARFGHEVAIAAAVAGFGEPFRSLCPINKTSWFARGKKYERLVPLFATYVFVDWEPKDDPHSWHRVNDLDGSVGFIGGEFPMPVRESDLIEWIENVDDDGVVRGIEELLRRLKRGFDRGDKVRIEGGTFDDRIGVCNWTDDRGVNLDLEIFDRSISVYITDADARFRLESKSEIPKKKKRGRGLSNVAVNY